MELWFEARYHCRFLRTELIRENAKPLGSATKSWPYEWDGFNKYSPKCVQSPDVDDIHGSSGNKCRVLPFRMDEAFYPITDMIIPSESILPGDNELTELTEGTTTAIVAQHMEISEPLAVLKSLLEARLGLNLRDFKFFLQDTQELDPERNLVDQCVQGEGLVQVNVEISFKNRCKKINIVDVLKPSDETLAELENEAAPKAKKKEKDEQVTKWVQSPEFKFIMDRENIPNTPYNWLPAHTQRWFRWAAKHFKLPAMSVNHDLWAISGRQLASLTHEQFLEKVPYDPSDLMWTHLELLRKCKIVAIVQSALDALPEAADANKKKIGQFRRNSLCKILLHRS